VPVPGAVARGGGQGVVGIACFVALCVCAIRGLKGKIKKD